ncbi:PorP/SprF family type IX secretion system membrane protein [Sunxiuqinia indica]|uniref:PorP/SprF family type IX secretion system membrane protein n=1 Tax=Sunxiuqinia indica TaxID=2692584 RepID=UPI00135749F5|nr:type IX secretion system membrane protein PorP/SprF [Sunxiuqinia indica]
MKKASFLILLLSLFSHARGQDAEYSQFYANPIYLNPGFTGTSERPRVIINYRNQWPQKGNTFVNYSLSYDQYFKKLNGGLGIQFHQSTELNGLVQTSSGSFFYSHHIKVSERLFFDVGLQAGVAYKKLDYGRLIFPDMIDQLNGHTFPGEQEQPENSSILYPDFGLGTLGQYDSFFFGFSLSHLTQPNESIIEGDQKGKLPMKFTFHAGSRTHKLHRGLLSREFTLSPNIIFQQQGAFSQVSLGMYILEKSLSGGVWYRQNIGVHPDAVILMFGVMKNQFKIGYSYDYTLSKLANYSSGSHEFSLTFFFGEAHNSRKAILIPSL